MRSVTRRARLVACAVVGALSVGAAAYAGPGPTRAASGDDVVHVGARPAPVYNDCTAGAKVVTVVDPGRELQVFARRGSCVWTVTPPDAQGLRYTGWINGDMLAGPDVRPEAEVGSPRGGPSLAIADGTSSNATSLFEAAESAKRASAAAARARASHAVAKPGKDGATGDPSSGTPPPPIGSTQKGAGSGVGDWIVPRALRASAGVNYQSANVRQAAGSLDERLLGGGGTIVASFAVLDPRILSVDFAGDFQASRTTSEASLASFRNGSGLQSYRLDLGVLSGRRAPLRLYADRVSSTSDLQPLGESPDPLRRTRGIRTDAGFTWDLDVDPALPHIWLAASTGRQMDERNYLFGYSSTNDERRAELRARRDYRLGRYDLQLTHGTFAYGVPAAGIRSDTGSDVLLASGRLTPSSRLMLDAHARGSRFVFGAGSQRSTVTGAGGDAAFRYQLPAHFATSGRYSFSNNAFEAALSGRVSPGQPGATPITSTGQLAARSLLQDGEGRVEYATRSVTAAVVGKGVSFDVPSTQATTLTALRTAGAQLHAQHDLRGVTVSAGADAALGTARSNKGLAQPYREMGAEASLSRDAARTLRFGIEGSARRVGRLPFFPVTLDATTAGARVETMRPGWARLRASVTRAVNLRDVMLSDARDRHLGYSLGLAGRWYDLSADLNQTDTRSLLLAPDVFGSRPEMAILIAAQPELFRNLLAATDRSRVFSLQLRPASGLQIQARVRHQEQAYPDLFGYRLDGGQAWASYQVRELQLEVGWEYFDSRTSFGNVRDRRVYVRVRRDVVFF